MAVTGNNTVVFKDDDGLFKCVLYKTPIVKWRDDLSQIVLNTGGYFSHVTKKRMNEAAQTYKLPFNVTQKAYQWQVEYNGKVYPYFDNMDLALLSESEGIA